MKLIAALFAMIITAPATAADKFLYYKYNDVVTIVISSALCPLANLKDTYKYAAAAFRVDGERLIGCYKKLDENFIEIQWHKGDKTVTPANAFLQPDSINPLPTPAPTL